MTHYEEYQKTGDINYFEEVIDAMVLDGISGMNDSFKNAISNLSREKKRMTILSLLDKDLNLFKRIKALTDNSINKMDHIKDVILMLREYVKVGEVEKKKYGEVMTPLDLVKEMLATLPEDVWLDPNLKWLDPANGTGPYPIMVVYKLMNGLKEWEPDDEKRYKHIIENMIYVCELQPKNMFLYMCAVDPFDTYKLNIYTGSFLEEGFDKHLKEVWSVEKFDIVVGNPPYNDNGGLKTGGKNLYQKFIKKSLEIFSNKIIYVTPPGFYKTTVFTESNDIYKKITTDNSLSYLNCSDINEKYFKVGTPIVYYMIEKSPYKKTSIENELGIFEVDISKYNFIPRLVSYESYSILEKILKNGTRLDAYRDDKAKMKLDKFLTLSTLNHLSNKGYWNTEVGSDKVRKRIVIKSEDPDKLKTILDSKLYRFIFFVYRHDGAVYHNFISGINIPHILDVDPYVYFGLTEDEIKFIENTIK
jgi:hypothetical protein